MTPPHPDPESLSPAAASLSAALHATDTTTLARSTYLHAFHTALPGAAAHPHHRLTLAALLDELTRTGLITAPANRQKWDPGSPPLPDWIRIPANSPTKTTPGPRPMTSWRPELTWAYDARLTAQQTEDLQAVNRWLRDTSGSSDARMPLPLRERSHEIFGDEKRLDALVSTALFAPSRLTLDQLATYRQAPPIAHQQISDQSTALVIENSDTYATLLTLLTPNPGPIGHVLFGCGRAFEASITQLTHLPGLRRILYYGDLDADGLDIPARTSATALDHNLPAIQPATGLYRLLLTRPRSPSQPISQVQAARLANWLPDDLQAAARTVLTQGHRIAQESANRRVLRTDAHQDRWFP